MKKKRKASNESLNYIISMDLDMIIDKMHNSYGWSKKDLIDISKLYRNFLILKKKNLKKELVPSTEIDEFWHNHILDTRKYIKDCEAIFGQYQHHYPYLGIDKKTNQKDHQITFAETQELYYQEFGDYIYEVRVKKWRIILFNFFNYLINTAKFWKFLKNKLRKKRGLINKSVEGAK